LDIILFDIVPLWFVVCPPKLLNLTKYANKLNCWSCCCVISCKTCICWSYQSMVASIKNCRRNRSPWLCNTNYL